MKGLAAVLALLCWFNYVPEANARAPRQTENLLFVMTYGLRWQEVFSGVDEALMNKPSGGVENVAALKEKFGRDTPAASRAALMPFVWEVMSRRGQLYGNRNRGSVARVTNGKNFSYPGYNETLCGFADPRIDSNDKRPNPNVTVLEWLNRRPHFQGRVAAFAAWDAFPWILNRERCGFYVNAGFELVTEGPLSPRQELLNRLKRETPSHWGEEPYDSLTFHAALEYFKQRRPRVFYVCLGETDEWAHAGRYADYLDAAHRVDDYLRVLWETAQSMPQYRGKTTLIFSPDHGRGDAPQGWKNHGAGVPGSENIFLAFLGPDTPPLGERTNLPPVTQSQIAATLAALLGEDYHGAVPESGAPIGDVLSQGGK